MKQESQLLKLNIQCQFSLGAGSQNTVTLLNLLGQGPTVSMKKQHHISRYFNHTLNLNNPKLAEKMKQNL
jgi:hypothetical protein